MPAFILGVEHPRGVACVRSLGRRGVPVISVDYRLSSSAAPYTCRYIKRREIVDPSSENAVTTLENLADARGSVLIPTNDEYLVFVAKNHERLSRTFKLAAPPWDRLAPVMDRVRCVDLARQAGLETARIFAPNDERELDAVLEQLDFHEHRYVLKLSLWTDAWADEAAGRKTTYGGAGPQELRERALGLARSIGEFPTIQELVPGSTDASIGVTLVVDRAGKSHIAYCVRRLKLQTYSKVEDFRHPYDLGGNVFCETVHDPEAVALAEALVRSIGWIGTITVELRRDRRDGSLVFVKIDPRVVRSTSLSTAIGMDVPSALYDVAIGQERAVGVRDYPAGICWIWLDEYFAALWKNRRAGSARRELIGLLRRWRQLKAFAYWDRRDPLPFLTQVALRLTWARRWVQPRRLSAITGFRTSAAFAARRRSPDPPRPSGAPTEKVRTASTQEIR